jgi:hypothetical protein
MSRENEPSGCLGLIHTMFSLLKYYKQCENDPSHLPISLFDKVPTSHSHIISSPVFKSKLFHFDVISGIFKNSAVNTNQNAADV